MRKLTTFLNVRSKNIGSHHDKIKPLHDCQK
ncbi:hypothetical protein CY0110_17077 [Crocosphaera chwakensis CCY0110]|uniref:Uncharacterized protein n=1 Tax=Crocosphaera chwakensis CCY0110 TaxID=391612 RepID=A3II97_9CHRO|nr:hypothetical protein CY0110_17077 [Crocosphaera chwakensis CCY0110]